MDLFKFKSLRKYTLILMYWWIFKFFMYFGLNLALESILHSGLLLTIIIALGALVEVFGSFGISKFINIFSPYDNHFVQKEKVRYAKSVDHIHSGLLCCTVVFKNQNWVQKSDKLKLWILHSANIYDYPGDHHKIL